MEATFDAKRRKKEKVLEAQRRHGAVPKKSTFLLIALVALVFLLIALTTLIELANG